MPHFSGIRACVFDAYGTLFDVHSAVGRSQVRVGAGAERLSQLWRAKQLEYTWLRSLMGRHADFWQVTQDALEYALAATGIADAYVRDELLAAYMSLDAYPDAPAVLSTLKARGLATAILSNGSPAMLSAAVESAGLRELLDAVLSVEEVGVYKPDPRVYALAAERLALPASAVCFVSANGWDAVGAASFGFRVAWINRLGAPPDRLPAAPQAEIVSLAELLPLIA